LTRPGAQEEGSLGQIDGASPFLLLRRFISLFPLPVGGFPCRRRLRRGTFPPAGAPFPSPRSRQPGRRGMGDRSESVPRGPFPWTSPPTGGSLWKPRPQEKASPLRGPWTFLGKSPAPLPQPTSRPFLFFRPRDEHCGQVDSSSNDQRSCDPLRIFPFFAIPSYFCCVLRACHELIISPPPPLYSFLFCLFRRLRMCETIPFIRAPWYFPGRGSRLELLGFQAATVR